MRRKVLAIGPRADRYDLSFPWVEVVRVGGLAEARQALTTDRFEAALLASDRDGYWIDRATEQLRALAPKIRLVVLVPGIDRRRSAEIASAGADYCASSWLTVIAQRLLMPLRARGIRASRLRPARRRLH